MGMAWKIIIRRGKIISRHWTYANYFGAAWSFGVGVALFLLIYNKLATVPVGHQTVILYVTLAAVTGLTVLYTAVTSVNAWFASPDAFYFTTAPLKFRAMFYYHWFVTLVRFLYRFAHLLLPGIIALAVRIGGVSGVFGYFALSMVIISVGVNAGFYLMFFLLYNKERPLIWGVFIAAIMVLTGVSMVFL